MPNLVVVAIPSANDHVWKISSEKIPHMTLLFLGEMPVQNFSDIAGFVDHASQRSLKRFGMEVDRRGVLGPEEADVLFFDKSKWSGYEDIAAFRAYLLQNSNVKAAYEAVEQFSTWLPHLTLGYPETPAKPDNRDYPGISYVSFDKIALWFNDYDGFEYPLKSEWDMLEVAMSSTMIRGWTATAQILHAGVKGMKWGVIRRRDQALFKKASETRKATKVQKRLAKADKKYEKSLSGSAGYIKMHNAVADHINRRIDGLNSNPKYADKDLSANPSLYNRYLKDYEKLVASACQDATNEIGANPSGTKRIKITSHGEGENTNWTATLEDVQHADTSISFRIIPRFNKTGHIIDQKIEVMSKDLTQSALVIDDILHAGVKGMKWGVRKDRSAVTVKQKGKKLKSKGGAKHPAHPDAIKTKGIHQVLKKSGIDALSNQDLQAYTTRLNLEASVKRLNEQKQPAAKKFVRKFLGQQAKTAVTTVADEAVSQQVKKFMNKTNIKPAEKKNVGFS